MRITPVPLAAIERMRLDDLCRLLHAEGGGRLVEADQLHVLAKGPGNRDRLALAARQGPDEDVVVAQRDAERSELLRHSSAALRHRREPE